MKRALTLALILWGLPAFAGPKHFARSIGHELKATFYTDVKAHPFAWGLNLGLQFGIAFADTATTCIGVGNGSFVEVGPAHYFVGRYPKCRKSALFTGGVMAVHSVSEHWLMNAFTDSCYREAAKPDSRWWKTAAHTHNPESCRWAVPVADTIGLAAYEIPVIRNNVELLK